MSNKKWDMIYNYSMLNVLIAFHVIILTLQINYSAL